MSPCRASVSPKKTCYPTTQHGPLDESSLQQPNTETAAVGTSPAWSAGCGPIHRVPSPPARLFKLRIRTARAVRCGPWGRGSRGAPMRTRVSCCKPEHGEQEVQELQRKLMAQPEKTPNLGILHTAFTGGVSGAFSCAEFE